MKINLQINRLVLDGVPVSHRDRPLLQASVESNLVRLISAGGLNRELETGVALPLVNAGAIQIPNVPDPTRLGGEIAQAVYGRIGEGAGSCSPVMNVNR